MKYKKAAIATLHIGSYSGQCLQLFCTRSTNECLHSSICSAEMYKQKSSKNNKISSHSFRNLHCSYQSLVIKIQVFPSNRATGTAGTPETQGIQKYLRKPLSSPSAFNSRVTTLRAEGPNPHTCPPDTATHALWLQIPFLYPDYWTGSLDKPKCPSNNATTIQYGAVSHTCRELCSSIRSCFGYSPSHSVPFSCFLSCIQSLTWTPKTGSLCILGLSIWFHWIFYLK